MFFIDFEAKNVTREIEASYLSPAIAKDLRFAPRP
jgi:hypothetical protein